MFQAQPQPEGFQTILVQLDVTVSAHADRSEQKVWQPERRGHGHQVTCLVQDSRLGSLLDQAPVCANQVCIHCALHLTSHLVLPALNPLPKICCAL